MVFQHRKMNLVPPRARDQAGAESSEEAKNSARLSPGSEPLPAARAKCGRRLIDSTQDGNNRYHMYFSVCAKAHIRHASMDGRHPSMYRRQDARRYDASGNMTAELDGKMGKKTIAYNSYNRIYEVRDGQTNQVKGQYWYDDQGFRIRKKAQLSRGGEYQDVDTLYPSKYFGMEIGDEFNAVNNIYLNGVRIAATTPNGTGVHYLTACARKRTSDTRPWMAAT